MKKILLENLPVILNNLDKEYDENLRTEKDNVINAINGIEKFNLQLNNSEFIDSVSVLVESDFEKINNLLHELSTCKIHDAVVEYSESLLSLLINFKNVDIDGLSLDLTSITIDIIDQSISYVNPNSISEFTNTMVETRDELLMLLVILEREMTVFKNKIKNPILIFSKNKNIDKLMEIDEVYKVTKNYCDKLNEVILTSKSVSDNAYRLSNEIYHTLTGYSKKFI